MSTAVHPQFLGVQSDANLVFNESTLNPALKLSDPSVDVEELQSQNAEVPELQPLQIDPTIVIQQGESLTFEALTFDANPPNSRSQEAEDDEELQQAEDGQEKVDPEDSKSELADDVIFVMKLYAMEVLLTREEEVTMASAFSSAYQLVKAETFKHPSVLIALRNYSTFQDDPYTKILDARLELTKTAFENLARATLNINEYFVVLTENARLIEEILSSKKPGTTEARFDDKYSRIEKLAQKVEESYQQLTCLLGDWAKALGFSEQQLLSYLADEKKTQSGIELSLGRTTKKHGEWDNMLEHLKEFSEDIKKWEARNMLYIADAMEAHGVIDCAKGSIVAGRKRFICANLRLVVSIAKKFRRRGLSFPELIQEGCEGLIKGVDHFEVSRGYRFSTYGATWIKRAIRFAISQHRCGLVNYPGYIEQEASRLRKAELALLRNGDIFPTDETLAKKLQWPIKKLRQIKRVVQKVRSLQTPVPGNEEHSIGEFVEDPTSNLSFSRMEIAENLRLLRNLVPVLLEPRERLVVELRHGIKLHLDSESTISYNEMVDRALEVFPGGGSRNDVGELLDVTHERVRQIETVAMARMSDVIILRALAPEHLKDLYARLLGPVDRRLIDNLLAPEPLPFHELGIGDCGNESQDEDATDEEAQKFETVIRRKQNAALAQFTVRALFEILPPQKIAELLSNLSPFQRLVSIHSYGELALNTKELRVELGNPKYEENAEIKSDPAFKAYCALSGGKKSATLSIFKKQEAFIKTIKEETFAVRAMPGFRLAFFEQLQRK